MFEVRSRYFGAPFPPPPPPATSSPTHQRTSSSSALLLTPLFISSTLLHIDSPFHAFVSLVPAERYQCRPCKAESRPLFGDCQLFRAGALPLAFAFAVSSEFWLPDPYREHQISRLTSLRARHGDSFLFVLDDECNDKTHIEHLDAVEERTTTLDATLLQHCSWLRPGLCQLQLMYRADIWPILQVLPNIKAFTAAVIARLDRTNAAAATHITSMQELSPIQKGDLVDLLGNMLPFLDSVECSLLIDTFGSLAEICHSFSIDAQTHFEFMDRELAFGMDKLQRVYEVLSGRDRALAVQSARDMEEQDKSDKVLVSSNVREEIDLRQEAVNDQNRSCGLLGTDDPQESAPNKAFIEIGDEEPRSPSRKDCVIERATILSSTDLMQLDCTNLVSHNNRSVTSSADEFAFDKLFEGTESDLVFLKF